MRTRTTEWLPYILLEFAHRPDMSRRQGSMLHEGGTDDRDDNAQGRPFIQGQHGYFLCRLVPYNQVYLVSNCNTS